MGKTETIKERAIYVYLPSIKLTNEWKKRAHKQGTSVSKFIINTVEDSLKKEEDPGYKARSELWKELEKLKQENNELRNRNRLLMHAIEKLEEENRRLRAQPFLEDNFTGVRGIHKELVEILRQEGVLSSQDILNKLGITASEHDTIKSVSKQLEILQDYGLVKVTSRGWSWIK